MTTGSTLASLASSLTKQLAELKLLPSQENSLAETKTLRFMTLTQTQFIYAMGNLQKTLEESNPFVLTAIQGRTIIMRKDSPYYEPKQNDRILSIDCVLANSDRLREIEQGIFELL